MVQLGRISWRSVLFAGLLHLLSEGPLLALNPSKSITQYSHKTWQTEDGLPQNSAQAMLQTRDGYIWIGTQEGIVRFDGATFRTFNRQNTAHLPNNVVTTMLEAKDGTLWIGTGGGGLVRRRGGAFTVLTTKDGLSSNGIWCLEEDPSGAIWIGTAGGGLNRLANGKFEAFAKDQGPGYDTVHALEIDARGTLWMGTDGGGLVSYSGGKFTPHTTRDGLSSDQVYSLLADRSGNLWIGTRAGIDRYRDGQFTRFGAAEGLSGDWVQTIFEDRHGSLWIGTYGGGLNRMREGRFEHFRREEGLTSNQVASIIEDREGSLWIGTQGGGINRLRDGNFTTYTVQHGLPTNVIWSIYQDTRSMMWLGTDSGGLSRYDGKKFETITTKDGLAHDTVYSVAEEPDGSAMWFGTRGGLTRLRGGKFDSFTTKDGLTHDWIRSLYRDRRGGLWIGTYGGGVNYLLDGKFRSWTKREGLGSDIVYNILEDRRGDIWAATRGGGAARIRGDAVRNFTKADGMCDDTVLAIHEDAAGVLWFGTRAGLNRYGDGKFTCYTTSQGLLEDLAFRIIEDRDQNFWMSSNKGVFRVARKELEEVASGTRKRVRSVAFGTADGMVSSECNGGTQPAGWLGRDGRIWFPTIKGAVTVDPARLQRNDLPPPVLVEELRIEGRAVDHSRSTRLAAGTRNFEIDYTALSFVAPEKVRFKYTLEGHDRDWIDAGGRRTAYYSSVPPGSYRFRVIACNNDGIWNSSGASIRFLMLPYFYQSSWFRILCGIALVTLIAGGYKLRVRQLARREKELARIVEEQTGQLQMANSQLADMNLVLQRLSSVDGLTGLANRRQFDEFLEVEWRRAQRNGTELSLIMIDIDAFKSFNDVYGHPRGDECLRHVAAALSDTAHRAGDLVARYGGEEFAVILPGSSPTGAAVLAEKLRSQIEALQILHSGSSPAPYVTVSLGTATMVPSLEQSKVELMESADEALYRAKRAGKNRVETDSR